MAGSKIRGITIELSADATGLMDSLKNINSEIRSTGTQLKDVDRLLKLDPTNTTLLTQKTQLLQEQITNTKSKLEELKAAQADMDQNGVDKNSEQYQALQREIIATEQELKKLESTAGSSSAALAKISAVTGEIGDKMESAGKKMAPVTAAITAGFAAAAKTAIDFESAFAGVKKTVDGTPEQLEEIRQGIIDMSERTASSATDIAAVAEAAGQLGVATEDVLSFTETMVMLGDTTNLTADEAASAMAKFANITGTSAEDYSRLGSVIVDLGNNFATTEADIVNMATNLASAGTLAGLTEPEILALSTAMSSVGIEAAAGGTAMTQTLTAIEKAVASSGDELYKIAEIAGMTAEDFSSAWKNDPITAIESFISGLGDLDEKGESATLVLDELGMSGIRQSNMLKSLALASDTLSGAIGTASTAWEENTALSEEAAKKYETTEAKISQLKATLAEVGIQIGDIILPVITKIIDGVKNALEWFTNLDEGTKEIIVTIAAVVAAISPLLVVGGKVMKGISSITGALSAMGTTAAGPIGLVIAAVAALAAGAAVLSGEFEKAYRATIPYVDELEELLEAHDDFVESMDNAKSTYESSVQASEANAAAAEYLMGRLQELVSAYDGTAGQSEMIVSLVDQLNELVPGMGLAWDSVTGSLSLANEEIYANIEAMKQQAQVAALQDLYTESLKQSYEAQQRYSEAQSALNQLLSDYGITWSDLDYILQDTDYDTKRLLERSTELSGRIIRNSGNAEALQMAYEALTDAENDVATAGETVAWTEEQLGVAMTQTAQQTEQVTVSIQSMYQNTFGTAIPEALNTAITAAQNAGIQIPATLIQGLSDGEIAEQSAIDRMNALVNFQTAVEAAGLGGLNVSQTFVDNWLSGQYSWEQANGYLNSLITFTEAIQTAQEGGTELTSEFVNGLLNSAGLSKVISAADQLGETAKPTIVANDIQTVGASVPENLSAGMESEADQVTATANQMAADVEDAFSSTPADMYSAGSESGSNLDSGFGDWSDTIYATVDDVYEIFNAAFNANGLGADMNTWGYKAGEHFNFGLTSYMSTIQSTVSSIVSGIATTMQQLPTGLYNVGYNAGQGLYNGLSSWQWSLSNLAWSIANSINAAARAALQIRSPSRVMEEVGEYTGEGLEIGLEKSGKGVLDTAAGIIETLTDTFTGTSLSAGIGALNSGINASVQTTAERTESSDSTIASVIGMLAQYLPYLAADKDIRFDDGTWAGVLAPSINRELEVMRARSARG